MNRTRVLAAAITVAALCATAQATVFSGRLGLSSYVWQKTEADSTDTRHLQNTGTASLRLDRIAGQDLELTASLRGRYDARNAGDNLSDYHVYNLQFRWRNIAHTLDVAGGRQQIAWPAGAYSIDGGSATAHLKYGFDVGGYLGLLAPEDGRFRMTKYKDGHAVGAQVGFHSTAAGNLAIFFSETHRARTYVRDEDTVGVNDLAARSIGLDWRRPIERWGSVYGQFLYDLLRQRFSRIHLSARWRATDAVTVNGQLRYRRPDIPYNSIFWVFGDSRYVEGRLRLDLRLNPTWSVTGGAAYVDLVRGGWVDRFEVGVGHRYFSATLFWQDGVSGKTIGISGDVVYPLNDRWMIRGGSHLSSFELIRDQAESNLETSWWAGVRWQWFPQSTWDLEGQLITQDLKTERTFAGDKPDFRVLARLSWWFFRRLNG